MIAFGLIDDANCFFCCVHSIIMNKIFLSVLCSLKYNLYVGRNSTF
jgi:hypothetical protein